MKKINTDNFYQETTAFKQLSNEFLNPRKGGKKLVIQNMFNLKVNI